MIIRETAEPFMWDDTAVSQLWGAAAAVKRVWRCGCTCMYTVGISPSFATASVSFLALDPRSVTTLSMAAWCFKKNGRITRLYNISEPFHDTGAIHHIRNPHWGESRGRVSDKTALVDLLSRVLMCGFFILRDVKFNNCGLKKKAIWCHHWFNEIKIIF